MIRIDKEDGDAVEMSVDGKVLDADYQLVLRQLDEVIKEHGELNCLFEFKHLTGVEPGAVWDDLKFDIRHARDIRKCAVVSPAKWQGVLMKMWSVFMPGCEVKSFRPEQRAAAAAWIRS